MRFKKITSFRLVVFFFVLLTCRVSPAPDPPLSLVEPAQVLTVPNTTIVRGWVNEALAQEVWVFPTEKAFEDSMHATSVPSAQRIELLALRQTKWTERLGKRLEGMEGSEAIFVPVTPELKQKLPPAFVRQALLQHTLQGAVSVPFLVFRDSSALRAELQSVLKPEGIPKILTWTGPSGQVHLPLTPELLTFARNSTLLPEQLARTLQSQYQTPMLRLKIGAPVPAYVSTQAGSFQGCDGPNCFYTVLRTHDGTLRPQHVNQRTFIEAVGTGFREVPKPQMKDIIVFIDPQTRKPIHAAIYLTETGDHYIVFEKNSMSHIDPSVITLASRTHPNYGGLPVCLRYYRALNP